MSMDLNEVEMKTDPTSRLSLRGSAFVDIYRLGGIEKENSETTQRKLRVGGELAPL